MTYEWLSKGKRRVNVGGSVKTLTVYPPRAGEIFPSFIDRGQRRFALPHDDGIYRAGAAARQLAR